MTGDPDIRFERLGKVACVTLDRPKALNALTLGMIRAFQPVLEDWGKDPDVQAVVIRGSGPKAFCAGGDVRAVCEAGLEGGELTRIFFREEYILNRTIKRFPKPFIALPDGITMGGGMGLSVHGRYRVATEKTVMAMPETAIGFFPDVGGSYFLSRLPAPFGAYVALTGARLKAADALYLGLATHYMPSERLESVLEEFARLDVSEEEPWHWDAKIAEILDTHSETPGAASLEAEHARIKRHFAHESIEGILDSLAAEDSDWAREVRESLEQRSPTSLKITMEQIRRAADLDFDACMRMEYRMSQGCMAGHDFYEGIRAVLIDKDHAPDWRPSTVREVSPEIVQAHFESLGSLELVFD
ncbi:enoyl-CoA hydratase/isomerase family protein [Fodinicurvata halophila]|uniref:3-hydroxyisobutyryl-CoA hydrolase n=1 Tax=Fodinicurvata halophila TaxID=1419723 RepID=A0ABV8UIT5_9PROT